MKSVFLPTIFVFLLKLSFGLKSCENLVNFINNDSIFIRFDLKDHHEKSKGILKIFVECEKDEFIKSKWEILKIESYLYNLNSIFLKFNLSSKKSCRVIKEINFDDERICGRPESENFLMKFEYEIKSNSSIKINERSKRSQVECGQSKYKPFHSLVAGGQSFEAGTWPWLVALYHHMKYQCGGTIVTPTVVISAAHCIRDKKDDDTKLPQHSFIIAGKHKLDGASEPKYTFGMIEKFIIHQFWKSNLNNYDSDIAIIKLSAPLVYSKSIQPICLPEYRDNHDDLIGMYGTIAGWGLSENEETTRNDPRIIDIPVVKDDVCIEAEIGFGIIMSHKTFCTEKNLGKSPCRGDSGSAFAVKVGKRWILRGIVSATVNSDCDGNNHVVFTDVAQFIRWINSTIAQFDDPLMTDQMEMKEVPDIVIPPSSTTTAKPTPAIIVTPPQPQPQSNNNSSNCGISPLRVNFAIKKDDLPWLSIQLTGSVFQCVGILVTNKHVISNAECTYEIASEIPRNVLFFIGQFDSELIERSSVRAQISQIKIHPNYSQGKFENDIAVVTLKSSVSAMPICLPELKTSINDIFKENLFAFGWEHVYEDGGPLRISGTAKFTAVIPKSQSVCEKLFSSTILMTQGQYFCASKERTDGLCDVAYGGFIMYQKNGRWTLRGMKIMLKMSPDSCDPNYPVLFIDIAQFMPWIQSIIEAKKLPQSLINPKPVKKQPSGCGEAEMTSFQLARDSMNWISIGVTRNEFSCVGHLITKRHLITVAWCIYPLFLTKNWKEEYYLVNKFNSFVSENTAMKAEISRVLLHNEYNDDTKENNIAVICLKKAVQYVSPICLPPPSTSTDDIDYNLFAYGWKLTNVNNNPQPLGNANLIAMNLLPKEECDRDYSDFLSVDKGTYFCTTADPSVGLGLGTCEVEYGESGLAYKKNDRWILRGLKVALLTDSSSGAKCNVQSLAFIDIAQYVPWVKSVVLTT